MDGLLQALEVWPCSHNLAWGPKQEFLSVISHVLIGVNSSINIVIYVFKVKVFICRQKFEIKLYFLPRLIFSRKRFPILSCTPLMLEKQVERANMSILIAPLPSRLCDLFITYRQLDTEALLEVQGDPRQTKLPKGIRGVGRKI